MDGNRTIEVYRGLEQLYREGLLSEATQKFVNTLRAKYPIGPDFCTPDPVDGNLPDGAVDIPDEIIRAVQQDCLEWYQAEMAYKISMFAAFDQIAYPAFLDAMFYLGVVADQAETPPVGRPKNQELREFVRSGLDRELTSKDIAGEWLHLHSHEHPDHDPSEALRKMTQRVKSERRKVL